MNSFPMRPVSARSVRKEDRKSTRLNSSHSQISYAVFCLKKKNVAGNTIASAAATLEILQGDTNADGFVDSADISQTKAQSGMPFRPSNFHEDPNYDAVIE